MTIPTEPIGSIPRPPDLLAAMAGHERGELSDTDLAAAQDKAVRDTIRRLEETGSPVVSDGEQSKPSFVTYPIAGLSDLAPGGIVIPFADGHQRQLPVLTSGPFHYQVHADTYLKAALGHAKAAVKQAVIAPSALSLLYPPADLDRYPRQAFLRDLINEAETDIRNTLEAGAHVRDRILAATRQLPPDRIGTCDDCGFAPFGDDTSTSRDIAFAKIRARVEGTALAAQQLGL
jgi:5-methyltetrahydropteroyltriglutamate--homocysteine methyltransferase